MTNGNNAVLGGSKDSRQHIALFGLRLTSAARYNFRLEDAAEDDNVCDGMGKQKCITIGRGYANSEIVS
ncbi:MAG: hypothetical protein ABII09_10420 [Planctomycetota bacterium]